uniref:t-SNARE coiled-coil homology domain-containing protein n=1 Tax=Aegilops tauschii subsp. strangulata TaxID=200361 RepID=A0A453Q3K4_AEGTS
MNARGYRSTRTALFDGIEEGGIRASAYSSHEIDEHENERAMDGLQDRVSILKRISGDINEEVEAHNRMLDRMGNDMDSSRGFLSGTVDKFKTVSGNSLCIFSLYSPETDSCLHEHRCLRPSRAGGWGHSWRHSSRSSC